MLKSDSKAKMIAHIVSLESELAKERRHSGAMAEWLFCESKGHYGTLDLDVEIGGSVVLQVSVRGMHRASGGVCRIVQVAQDWSDLPQYFDDLCSDWAFDAAPEIRDAARRLRAKRDELNKVGKDLAASA